MASMLYSRCALQQHTCHDQTGRVEHTGHDQTYKFVQTAALLNNAMDCGKCTYQICALWLIWGGFSLNKHSKRSKETPGTRL